jgi:hypothetical protein
MWGKKKEDDNSDQYPVYCTCGAVVGYASSPGSTGICSTCEAEMLAQIERDRAEFERQRAERGKGER